MTTTMTTIAPVRDYLVLDTVKLVINRAMMGLPVRPLGKGFTILSVLKHRYD